MPRAECGGGIPVPGPPVSGRRVALVSSAGLRRHDDRPFTASSSDYRIVPFEKRNEVVQDHRQNNSGKWRHGIDKYLGHDALRAALAQQLGIDWS